MIQAREGAEHVRLRRSVTPYFSRPGTEAMRPVIRRLVSQVLDELEEHEDIDFLLDVCARVPAEVYCAWVGTARSDVPFVIGVAARINLLFVHEEGHAQTIVGLLDAVEIRDQATMLLEGSTDNTSQQIALTVAAILEHRAEFEKLRRDPSLIPAAVEEGLRYSSRVLTYDRFPREDVVVGGVDIPAGATVLINVRSAHRDESDFTEPERLDVTRTGEPGPLTFGGGAHACIGVNVARVEVQETLRALVERFRRRACRGTSSATGT